MIRLTGAQLVVRLLERQGVRVVTGTPGGADSPLRAAFARSPAIRYVPARHERGAGFIAQGLARVSGRPAVCLASSGPAADSLAAVLAAARLDAIPLICMTEGADLDGASAPTKHAFRARAARELLEIVPAAFRIAASGRPGPVLLDIPVEVQAEIAAFAVWPAPGEPQSAPAPEPAAVTAAAALIDRARRPLLYLGGDVVHGGASGMAQRLAEKAGLPTVMTLAALGALPAGHPQALGVADAQVERTLAECDLLIMVGARFDARADARPEAAAVGARIIRIDIEPDRGERAALTIGGDLGSVLAALLPQVTETPRGAWQRRVAALKARQARGDHDPRTLCGLVRAVAALAGERAIVAADLDRQRSLVAQAYPLRRPRRWLSGHGTVGFGLPAAIGAALADPAAPVICFCDESGLLLNLQELATAAEQRVNLKVVLCGERASDGGWRSPFGGQEPSVGGVDFCRIAAGFGFEIADLGASGHPRALLAPALNQAGPCLIRAPVRSTEYAVSLAS